jgi:hypothetical protein
MLDDYGFGYLALVFESKQTVREPRPDFITATNSFLHSPLCEPDHLAPLLQSFKVPLLTCSATPADGEPLQTRFSVMTGERPAFACTARTFTKILWD